MSVVDGNGMVKNRESITRRERDDCRGKAFEKGNGSRIWSTSRGWQAMSSIITEDKVKNKGKDIVRFIDFIMRRLRVPMGERGGICM